MFNTPFKYSDLPRYAGKFVEAESRMFEQLPADAVIVVGGNAQPKPTSYRANCWLCGAATLLDRRDDISLAGKKRCTLCPECYLKMEPKVAGG